MRFAAVLFLSGLLFASPVMAQEIDEPVPTPDEPISAPQQAPNATMMPPPGPPPAPNPPPPPPRPTEDPENPVVRAQAGNIGMFFQFGGLASLMHTSDAHDFGNQNLVFFETGFKFVLSEHIMIPIWFGTGLTMVSPETGDAATDWGIHLGGGLEYHFRIWRRLSPFLGGSLAFSIEDPSGDTGREIGVGVSPCFGVEYYIADRVSLTAMYLFSIQMKNRQSQSTAFGFFTSAGGAVNIAYYF